MKKKVGLGSGLVGATSVAILNQVGSRLLPSAPRLDVLGMQLATVLLKRFKISPPTGLPLKLLALGGSLASNSIFYGLVGLGRPSTAWVRGGALGLAMGLGALALPEVVGVGQRATARTPMTKAGTLAWYILGGVLAAATFAGSARAKKRLR